jgi:hypothetical protein
MAKFWDIKKEKSHLSLMIKFLKTKNSVGDVTQDSEVEKCLYY